MPRIKNATAVVAALLITSTLAGCQSAADAAAGLAKQIGFPSSEKVAGFNDTLTADVLRTVDGDTIAVSPTAELPATNDAGTEHIIRILGTDSAEMNKVSSEPAECGAQEATDFVSSLVDGRTVTITFDSLSDHTDRYGRSLAYVELDGADVGLQVIEAGFAEAWFPYGEPEPERYAGYAAAQDLAVASGAGAHAFCDSIGR